MISAAKRFLILFVCLAFAGCATLGRNVSGLADNRAENTFAYPPTLPMNLQRVAILPLSVEETRGDLPDGCDTLNPILLQELAKLKKFEVVAVNREDLRRRMGRAGWTGAEVLPADFFASLQRTYGCDAVLFCQLTVFQTYAPLAVGWRFKMVDVRTRQILWAADEVCDAGQPSVLKAATRYQVCNFKGGEADGWSIRNSPRQFGQYAAARLLATLPAR
ncbi:MAG: hypothetical protein U1F65_04505 [Verrucomicrobiota bacterium]